MRIPTRKSEILRNLLRKDDYFVTPEKIASMERDLLRLTKTERPLAAEEVHRTKQMGDLSENAAYQEAKVNLRRINDRISSLESRLKLAVPIETGTDADGRIRIGSTVTLMMDGKRMLTFQILGSQETSPDKGRISHLSPLGAALLGRRVGETFQLEVANEKKTYDIVTVT